MTMGVSLRLNWRGDSLHGVVVSLHDLNCARGWVPALCGLVLRQKLSIPVKKLVGHILHRLNLAVTLGDS